MEDGMSERLFIVVSNTRSGSTHFATSLNLFDGVSCNFQANWHASHRSPDDFRLPFYPGCDVAEILREALPDSQARGTKLTFNAQAVTTSADQDSVYPCFSSDISIVHLHRHYFDIYASRFGRGTVHLLNEERDPAEGGNLVNSVQNVAELAQQAEHAMDPMDSYKAILQFYTVDLIASRLAQQSESAFRIDYPDIGRRLGEVLQFLGVQTSADAIRQVRERPLVKKLPPLNRDKLPNCDFAQDISNVFVEALYRFDRGLGPGLLEVREDGDGELAIGLEPFLEEALGLIWERHGLNSTTTTAPGPNRIKNIDAIARLAEIRTASRLPVE